MLSMAITRFALHPFSPSSLSMTQYYFPNRVHSCNVKSPDPAALLSSISDTRPSSYNPLVFQAVMLLGPPAKFEASKLKVVFKEDKTCATTEILPRTYTLSHCDFTANLTLTISKILYQDQLQGWYSKDDVVAEWTKVRGNLFLDVHCYVSGQNFLSGLAAELRYHIFSKELPLVLKAVLHGDSGHFEEHPQLMDALVRVFFHSSSKKYNRVEYWGPLREATWDNSKKEDENYGLWAATGSNDTCHSQKAWGSPKSIFLALVAFLLLFPSS